MKLFKRRAGDRPVPGAEQAIASTKAPGAAAGRDGGRAAPGGVAAAPGHGGVIKTIKVYADGRTEIADHRKNTTETIPGACGECEDPGACSICAFWTVYDVPRGRWIRRYQKCPAHAEREHQP